MELRITPSTHAAASLVVRQASAALSSDADILALARRDCEDALERLGLPLALPRDPAKFRSFLPELNRTLEKHLYRIRYTDVGDTVALPLYVMGRAAYVSLLYSAALEDDSESSNEARLAVEDALLDLGLGTDFVARLDELRGWALLEQRWAGERVIRPERLLQVGAQFLVETVQELQRHYQLDCPETMRYFDDMAMPLSGVRTGINAFADRLARCSGEANAGVADGVSMIHDALIEGGASAETAYELTRADPRACALRLVRWSAGTPACSPNESRLWRTFGQFVGEATVGQSLIDDVAEFLLEAAHPAA